jgi:hypothetical protein
VADDRPLDGLFGPGKGLAGPMPFLLGLGDSVAGGKNPVFEAVEGLAGGETAGHWRRRSVVVLVVVLVVLVRC